MTQPEERLRPHPSVRLTGPAVPLNLRDLAQALHAEPHASTHGHRQASLAHRGPLRLVLFAFEPGASLPEHRAPGHVVIQCLRGRLEVDAAGGTETLSEGDALVIDPDVPHGVRALAESDMLLMIAMAPRETTELQGS